MQEKVQDISDGLLGNQKFRLDALILHESQNVTDVRRLHSLLYYRFPFWKISDDLTSVVISVSCYISCERIGCFEICFIAI